MSHSHAGPRPGRSRRPGRSGRSAHTHGAAGRRLDMTVVVAVVLVLLTAGALVLTRPDAPRTERHRPTPAALTTAVVTCPDPLDPSARVGIAGLASGSVMAGSQRLTVRPHAVAKPAPAAGPVVVQGSGATAPGLVAGLSSLSPLTASDCLPPAADQWFTGVGGGPTHASVVELVNPNPGPAIADIDIIGGDGPVDVPSLRGLEVAGHGTASLDLGKLVPTTDLLALHVTVDRGQVGVAVRDRGERLSGSTTTQDWLAPQAAPARRNLLLGVQTGTGRQTLALANDTDSEVRATVRLVTAASTFTPASLKPVVIKAHSVSQTILDDVLSSSVATGAVGLEVSSSAPVTASLRAVVGNDLSLLAPGRAFSHTTLAVVPKGSKTLVLAGATGVGAVTVLARNGKGKELLSQRLVVGPDRATTLALPSDALSVEVTPERAAVQGAVLIKGDGSAVVRLRELVRSAQVPHVAPGLP